MFDNDTFYTVNFMNVTYWFWCNNAKLAELHEVAESEVSMLHSAVFECEDAPFGRVIILSEDFTGTPIEMSIVEHEIGHIIAGHTAMTVDEYQINNEIEADSYVNDKAMFEQVLLRFKQLFNLPEYQVLDNISFLKECTQRRLDAIRTRA